MTKYVFVLSFLFWTFFCNFPLITIPILELSKIFFCVHQMGSFSVVSLCIFTCLNFLFCLWFHIFSYEWHSLQCFNVFCEIIQLYALPLLSLFSSVSLSLCLLFPIFPHLFSFSALSSIHVTACTYRTYMIVSCCFGIVVILLWWSHRDACMKLE